MSERSTLYLVSVGAHALLALGLGTLRPQRRVETIAIAVVEAPPPTAIAAPPPPPEPAPEPAAPAAPAKPAPAAPKTPAKAAPKAPAAEPAAAEAPLPDFGLALSGGVGGPGLAVPVGSPQGAPGGGRPASAPRPAARPAEGGCDEPAAKPKARAVPQPAYAERARAAGVEGKVRVEINVDERGRVTGARVLQGLGHGLDEAALDAARRASFEPASRCGKAVAATFVLGMKFSL